ncbi:MAG TPA: hypothetical protein DCP37_08395 [Dehalococcoidia bacterium]|jgi:hypothetical protein|nr:hypothetical protein [SAR202 cluster bacterium]MQG57435.1 hypothetical protein [SAR202 cluster bacterium]HAL47759.1 hypothetical protein [Dehalococcoidia bacterium]|tara:strand:+ start:2051 stop:2296 length:246 start_codon:yes stop_codon:yes gene_type:complete
MKLEVITVSPNEDRVLLFFDPEDDSGDDDKVRSYLAENSLGPKREYTETRESTDYNVYYFGHCYIKDHMESLTAMASEGAP